MELFKQVLEVLKEWLGLLAPFGLVGATIWKLWLKKRYEEGRELYNRILKMSEEFRPNGGSSLRDAINRIEEMVTINEQKTLAILKSSPSGTWLTDAKGKWVDVNRNLCKFLGRTESELKGDNWSNWVRPSDKEDVFEEWQRCISNDLNFDLEFEFTISHNKYQKVHAIAYQLKDRNGKLVGFLGTLNPI